VRTRGVELDRLAPFSPSRYHALVSKSRAKKVRMSRTTTKAPTTWRWPWFAKVIAFLAFAIPVAITLGFADAHLKSDGGPTITRRGQVSHGTSADFLLDVSQDFVNTGFKSGRIEKVVERPLNLHDPAPEVDVDGGNEP
jgi:hypothetical protein